MWVGFRPGSRDDAPILGATTLPRLVVATGHHRSGILLTPATTEAIAEYVLTGSVPARIRPFACDRFRLPGLARRQREDA
jgi:glycine oxidase